MLCNVKGVPFYYTNIILQSKLSDTSPNAAEISPIHMTIAFTIQMRKKLMLFASWDQITITIIVKESPTVHYYNSNFDEKLLSSYSQQDVITKSVQERVFFATHP